MNDSLKRFQDHLRQVFQLDWADLDFGIYRILTYKRQQIVQFINTRLPQIVDEAFAEYSEAEREALQQELARLKQEITTSGAALGQDPFDANGELKEGFRQGKLGKQYLSALASLESIHVTEELKNRVYNDLFSFFSRYYEDGDFISKRRYSQKETYAIPYNGEEVVLHWANKDQYYIKSGEWHKSYRFRVGDFHVAFALKNVAPDQKGNQDDKRYYVLSSDDALDWNPDTKTLTIFFEFRLLTNEEKEHYGKTETQKPQLGLNEESTKTILEQVQEPALRLLLAKPESRNGKENSVLGWRLNHFTIRNTADFFIHKDLRGFLRRELQFFIKNEVLLLDELVAGDMAGLDRHVRRARVVRRVANSIIDFLAQVENFQKRLFEKKKFIVRTDYCLTVDRVPEDLWDEILANKTQIEEWRRLFVLDEIVQKHKEAAPLIHTGLDKDFLRLHTTLVIDTRNFPEDFKWRLLASIRDMDEVIDGVVIRSENYQALRLLVGKYQEQAKCIYTDPPYNTGSDEFIYRDRYQHSSWICMMEDRLKLGREVLAQDGAVFISIDEKEVTRLKELMSTVFNVNNYVGEIVWKNATDNNPTRIAQEHEYVLCFAKDSTALPSEWKSTYSDAKDLLLTHYQSLKQGQLSIDEIQKQFRQFIKDNEKAIGELVRYKFVDEEGPYTGSESVHNPHPGGYDYEIIHPITGKPMRKPANGYRFPEDTMKKEYVDKNRLIYGPDENRIVKIKLYLQDHMDSLRSVVILDGRLGAYTLNALFGKESSVYDNPKPVQLIERLISFAADDKSLIMDFFAGSGTTAQTVIEMTRKYGKRSRYILVEMGDWIETVILPRIKKSVFCEQWKDGKPTGNGGVSHFFKYHHLEQYEDTLTNLELPHEKEGQLAFAKFGDEYLLRYMLDFETQGSQSLLNLDAMKDPFSYKLKVQEDDEYVERPVDLVETFNYLLGLNVKRMQAFSHGNRPYRVVSGEKQGKRVVILWRPLIGLEDSDEALMKEKTFVEKTVLPAILPDAKPDRLFANGPCAIEGAESIEPEFKRLMFAGVV